MLRSSLITAAACAALTFGSAVHAQQPAPLPNYGAPITLEQAMKAVDAAQAEAKN